MKLNKCILVTIAILLGSSALAQVPLSVQAMWYGYTTPTANTPTPPLAHILAWYKAEIGVYTNATGLATHSGDSVYMWADQSGNGYNVTNFYQSTANVITNRIGGGPSGSNHLDFSGNSTNNMWGIGYNKTNNFSIFFVSAAESGGISPFPAVAGQNVFANVNDNEDFDTLPPHTLGYYDNTGTNLTFDNGPGPGYLVQGHKYVISLLLSNNFGDYYVRTNGANYFSARENGQNNVFWNMNGWIIGGRFTNAPLANMGFCGQLSELLIYETCIPVSQYTNVENYLMTKYP